MLCWPPTLCGRPRSGRPRSGPASSGPASPGPASSGPASPGRGIVWPGIVWPARWAGPPGRRLAQDTSHARCPGMFCCPRHGRPCSAGRGCSARAWSAGPAGPAAPGPPGWRWPGLGLRCGSETPGCACSPEAACRFCALCGGTPGPGVLLGPRDGAPPRAASMDWRSMGPDGSRRGSGAGVTARNLVTRELGIRKLGGWRAARPAAPPAGTRPPRARCRSRAGPDATRPTGPAGPAGRPPARARW